MRVAVVGASGNVGTGLLRALRDDSPDHEVVGVVRRAPAAPAPEPYAGVRWWQLDLAAPGPDDGVVTRLAGAFDGVDAVVHLAWAIQPSHDRDLLRRTNVVGSRRVIAAAARAGVPHLVAVSSVGAYTPAHDDTPRSEEWPTAGTPSSDYSVDKVALERLLDRAATEHAGLAVARVRPALVFQRAAASGIERYFMGPAVPGAALRRTLPVLPWPRGLRLQGVHADDLGQLLAAVVRERAVGAFNAAADDVLHAQEVAEVVAAGRAVEIPHGLTRLAVWAGWTARQVAASPGWFDLAASVPVLSSTRARTELGWRPVWSTREALASLVRGLADGDGAASPAMRPRARARRSLLGGQASSR